MICDIAVIYIQWLGWRGLSWHGVTIQFYNSCSTRALSDTRTEHFAFAFEMFSCLLAATLALKPSMTLFQVEEQVTIWARSRSKKDLPLPSNKMQQAPNGDRALKANTQCTCKPTASIAHIQQQEEGEQSPAQPFKTATPHLDVMRCNVVRCDAKKRVAEWRVAVCRDTM